MHRSRGGHFGQNEGLLDASQDSFGTNSHLATNLRYLNVFLRNRNDLVVLAKYVHAANTIP